MFLYTNVGPDIILDTLECKSQSKTNKNIYALTRYYAPFKALSLFDKRTKFLTLD